MAIEIIVMVFALAPEAITPIERLVLIVLANYADKAGQNIFPAVTRIARETSLGRRTVQLALRRLAVKGFTTIVGEASRHATKYEINLEVLARERSKATVHRAPRAQSDRKDRAANAQSSQDDCAPHAQLDANDCARRAPDCAPDTQICASRAPDPSITVIGTVRTDDATSIEGGDDPYLSALTAFSKAWGQYYRSPFEATSTDRRAIARLTAEQLERWPAALVQFFGSSRESAFYRERRHPLKLLVAQCDRVLAAIGREDDDERPGRHIPSAEETDKYLRSLRVRPA